MLIHGTTSQCSAGLGETAFLSQLLRQGTLGVFALKMLFVGCWVWHAQAAHRAHSLLGLMIFLLLVSLSLGLFSSLLCPFVGLLSCYFGWHSGYRGCALWLGSGEQYETLNIKNTLNAHQTFHSSSPSPLLHPPHLLLLPSPLLL